MLWLFFNNANYDIFSVPIIQSITRLRPKNECIKLIEKILLANETTTFLTPCMFMHCNARFIHIYDYNSYFSHPLVYQLFIFAFF